MNNEHNRIMEVIKILREAKPAEDTVMGITELLENHGYEIHITCINCGQPATHGVDEDYPQCDADYHEEQLQSSEEVEDFFEELFEELTEEDA